MFRILLQPAPTLKGKFVTLRQVTEDDAAFIVALRTDPERSQHINPVENDVEKQRVWIREHNRRAEGYYFIICDKENQPCGAVRLHDVTDESFVIGSWVMQKGCSAFAIMESLVMAEQYGFEAFGSRYLTLTIRNENHNSHGIHQKMGAKPIKNDDDSIHYQLKREDFESAIRKYRWFNH